MSLRCVPGLSRTLSDLPGTAVLSGEALFQGLQSGLQHVQIENGVHNYAGQVLSVEPAHAVNITGFDRFPQFFDGHSSSMADRMQAARFSAWDLLYIMDCPM